METNERFFSSSLFVFILYSIFFLSLSFCCFLLKFLVSEKVENVPRTKCCRKVVKTITVVDVCAAAGGLDVGCDPIVGGMGGCSGRSCQKVANECEDKDRLPTTEA